jgi:lipopolysaccharide/colanic/teichoic acid biosynthesis glycosyltransferase
LLRSTKVDELPQLLNVVLGQMSFVGPRPEVPGYVRLYTPEQRAVLRLRPGITSPVAYTYVSENYLLGAHADPEAHYVQDVMPDKIRIGLEYAEQATLWRDFVVILKTLLSIARR